MEGDPRGLGQAQHCLLGHPEIPASASLRHKVDVLSPPSNLLPLLTNPQPLLRHHPLLLLAWSTSPQFSRPWLGSPSSRKPCQTADAVGGVGLGLEATVGPRPIEP